MRSSRPSGLRPLDVDLLEVDDGEMAVLEQAIAEAEKASGLCQVGTTVDFPAGRGGADALGYRVGGANPFQPMPPPQPQTPHTRIIHLPLQQAPGCSAEAMGCHVGQTSPLWRPPVHAMAFGPACQHVPHTAAGMYQHQTMNTCPQQLGYPRHQSAHWASQQAAPAYHQGPSSAHAPPRIMPASMGRKTSAPEALKHGYEHHSMTLEQMAAESATAAITAASAAMAWRSWRSNSPPTSAAIPPYGNSNPYSAAAALAHPMSVDMGHDWGSTTSTNTTASSTPTAVAGHHQPQHLQLPLSPWAPAFNPHQAAGGMGQASSLNLGVPTAPAAPPPLQLPGTIRYACRGQDIDMLISQMMSNSKPKVVGFDIEWKPNFVKGEAPNRVALIQIAYHNNQPRHQARRSWCSSYDGWSQPDSSTWYGPHSNPGSPHPPVVALLLQVSGLTSLPPGLTAVLTDPEVSKAGVGIRGDASKLSLDWGVQLAGVLDLSDLANSRVLHDKPLVTTDITTCNWSLAGLVCTVLYRSLSKCKQVRLSNWETQPLSAVQQQYAALDAYAGLALHDKLVGLPLRSAGTTPAL